MTAELLARAIVYALASISIIAAAFWWGWDQRTRLALKLEHFNVTNKRWTEYDAHLKKEGRPPARGELHDIHERESRR